MKRISLKGVVIGNIVDIVSTNIAAFPIVMFILISSGRSGDTNATTQAIMASSIFRVSSIILGSLCSVLAGYVSARIAKHHEILNGALSSIFCVAGGMYAVISGSGSAAVHLALLPLSPVLGALGGYLGSRRNGSAVREAALSG